MTTEKIEATKSLNYVWWVIGLLAYKLLAQGSYASVAHLMRKATALGLVNDWRTCILMHYSFDEI